MKAHFPEPAATLYFGGGTPSLVPPLVLRNLVNEIELTPGAEVSLEANPEDVNERTIEQWIEAGINRLSLGVQTLDDSQSPRLGRRHRAAQVVQVLRDVARTDLRSWSVDLLFGLPGQSTGELRDDLEELLSFDPPHVSLYGLTLEPGTVLQREHAQGRLRLPHEDLWAEQYELVVTLLNNAGCERYEVSNFARDGHRSQHNEATWRGGYYAGLGPSAHGFHPDGTRSVNPGSMEDWLTGTRLEQPSPHQAAIDLVLSTLRHVDGLPLDVLRHRTTHQLDLDALESLFDSGLLVLEAGHLRLTADGFPIADGITLRVVRALQRPSATEHCGQRA
jgi:oxygen-independent coproporphyrinogen-3 oxidase